MQLVTPTKEINRSLSNILAKGSNIYVGLTIAGSADKENIIRRILVGCFGLNGPSRQYFSLYRAVSQREGEKETRKDRGEKKCPNNPTRTYCKRSRPLPYFYPN